MIFKNSGFEEVKKYRYWNKESRGLDINGMLEDLKAAPEGAVIVLHACAHNPTGIDPTHDQVRPRHPQLCNHVKYLAWDRQCTLLIT